MNTNEREQQFSKTERRVLATCALLMLLFLCLFLSEDLYRSLFGQDDFGRGPSVARLAQTEQDVRYKSSASLDWTRGRIDAPLRPGDSVFTGEGSRARVKFESGGEIELRENTLISIQEVDGLMLPNLEQGSFEMTVPGHLKVSINGEITELDGNARVRVTVGSGKPKVQLLEGQAKLKTDRGIATSLRNLARTMRQENQVLSRFEYYLRLEDLYRRQGKSYWLLDSPTHFPQTVSLSLPKKEDVERLYIQQDQSLNFSNPWQYETTESSFQLRKAFVGKNYWRYSSDQKNWSEPMAFELSPRLVEDPKIVLALPTSVLILGQGGAQSPLRITGGSAFRGYLLESSPTAEFAKGQVSVTWMDQPESIVKFQSPTTRYYRARGVTEDDHLGTYSNIVALDVRLPTLPEAPELTPAIIRGYINESLTLRWKAKLVPDRPVTLEVVDEKEQVLTQKVTTQSFETWKSATLGDFFFRVIQTDPYGRRLVSETGKIEIRERMKLAKVEPPAERKPAQVNTTVDKLDSAIPPYLNRHFDSNKFSIEASMDRAQGSVQRANNEGAPLIASIALRGILWNERNGYEAVIKSKAADLNPQGAEQNMLQVETRYHRRFWADWSPFSDYAKSEYSVFAGYEIYRNPGTRTLAKAYDLIKMGTQMEFPLWRRWDTGGEFVYGQGLEGSKKYEISGHLHYYLEKTWSAGVGYRIHLFEAGTEANAPGPLPYREGYTEGYSVLRWHY